MWSPSQIELKPLASTVLAISSSSGHRTSRSTSGSCTPISSVSNTGSHLIAGGGAEPRRGVLPAAHDWHVQLVASALSNGMFHVLTVLVLAIGATLFAVGAGVQGRLSRPRVRRRRDAASTATAIVPL